MAENPGLEKVERLMEYVHQGSYVIPHFQRDFEWQPTMVCDLVESLLQNYYAGSILLWDLEAKQAGLEEWEPVWGAKLRGIPQKAILDGQQRLASLYYAIHNPTEKFPNRKSYYLFFLSLNMVLNEEYEGAVTYKYRARHQGWDEMKSNSRQEFIGTGTVPLAILSARDPNNPIQKFIDSKEFEDWLNDYISKNGENLPEDVTALKAHKVLSRILDYPFVFYPLGGDRNLPDICNIFARVNAKGMKLSTFDLMNAFLYPRGVKLRVELWEGLDNELLKAVDPNMNEYLLKLMSLVKQNYCSSNYLYNLVPGEKTIRKDEHGKKYEQVLVESGEEFKGLWRDVCKYAEEARSIIMNTGDAEFGAIKTAFIPNTTLVPVLGAILYESEGESESAEFRRNLRKWYWSAVFSEDYSGSSDTVMARDFRDWKAWIHENRQLDRLSKMDYHAINELDLINTKKGSSRYNAILCLLALNDARDFYKGRIVGTGDYSNEKINDHHIFPKQAKGLDQDKCRTYEHAKDSVLNRTLLLDETNVRIRNKRPSVYIADLVDYHSDEEKVRSLLRTHLITQKAFDYMKQDDFDSFAQEREKAIRQHITVVLGIEV